MERGGDGESGMGVHGEVGGGRAVELRARDVDEWRDVAQE